MPSLNCQRGDSQRVVFSTLLLAALILTGCDGVTRDAEIPLVAPTTTTVEAGSFLPQPSGKLLYHNEKNRNFDIFLFDVRTRKLVPLTDSAGNDVEPSWSPDGKQIAFICGESDRRAHLCVMEGDGSNRIRLTERDGAAGSPRWSPDGTRILFHAFWERGPIRLYMINADGSGLKSIDTGPGNALWADWSPDGTRIAYVSDRDGNDEIYVTGVEGGRGTRLTGDAARDRYPRWSPDGRRILFTSTRKGRPGLYTMSVEGKDVRMITDGTGKDTLGCWADGGAWIVFGRTRGGGQDAGTLMAIRPDGTGLVDILPGALGLEGYPDWHG